MIKYVKDDRTLPEDDPAKKFGDGLSAQDFKAACAAFQSAKNPEIRLALARDARAIWPDKLQPALEIAKTLSVIGDDPEAEILAWQTCLDRFPHQARPQWFAYLRAAVGRRLGSLRFCDDVDNYVAQIEGIYAAAQGLWPEPATDLPAPTSQNLDQSRQDVQYISEWIAFDRATLFDLLPADPRSLSAWQAYFQQNRQTTPMLAYLGYIKAIEGHDPVNAAKRTEALLEQAQQIWPVELLQTEAISGANTQKTHEAASLYLLIGKRFLDNRAFDKAKAMLGKIPNSLPQGAKAREFEKVAGSLSLWVTYQDLTQSDSSFSETSSIVVYRSLTGSDQVVFVFTRASSFLTPAQSAMHLVLRTIGCNVVYILDANDSFFTTGPDWENHDQLKSRLRKAADELEATKIYTMGGSLGGYGALRFGVDMGANGVLVFSPITTPMRNSWSSTRSLFRNIQNDNPSFIPDLDTYFATLKTLPDTTIVYGAKSPRDKVFAHALKGFSGVKFIEVPELGTHDSFRWSLANDKFKPMLLEMLRDGL